MSPGPVSKASEAIFPIQTSPRKKEQERKTYNICEVNFNCMIIELNKKLY